MRAILDGFLTVFAPLEAIIHDIDVGARFDGIPRLPRPLGALLLPGPVGDPDQRILFCQETVEHFGYFSIA
jgi:hypothetical protein